MATTNKSDAYITGLDENGNSVTGLAIKVYATGGIVVMTLDGEVRVIDGEWTQVPNN